jgi:hypothetical protein
MPRKNIESEPKESKERARIRLDSDIEQYLKNQSERVLGKTETELDGADLTLIANRLLYEHKLAQSLAKKVPLTRLVNWLMSWVSGDGKVIALDWKEPQALKPSEPSPQPEDDFDFDFEANLGDLYDEKIAEAV